MSLSGDNIWCFWVLSLLYEEPKLFLPERRRENKKPQFELQTAVHSKSGRWDLNPGPLTPHASALAGLRQPRFSYIAIEAR